MRKIVMFNLVSIDGYFTDEKGEISWHVVDDEFNKWAVKTINDFDTILFGRITYEIFKDFWPQALHDQSMSDEDHIIAKAIDDYKKIVFSTQDLSTDWQGTVLWHEIDIEKIKGLKAETDKDIVIYGSGTIVKQFSELDLIDEYRLLVNPVILGKGKKLFENIPQKELRLIDSKVFGNGNVLLSYSKKIAG
jgi:dihydrofolate reductase